MSQILDSVWSELYRATEYDPVKWSEEHMRPLGSSLGNRVDKEAYPWLWPILEAYASDDCWKIVVQASAQSGKTFAMLCCMGWRISEQPSNMIVALNTDDMSTKFARSRFNPMMDACGPVSAVLPERATGGRSRAAGDRLLKEVYFKNGTFLMIGAANESFLRSHSVKCVFGDEASDWEKGAIENAIARANTFGSAKKIWISSTPLNEGDGRGGEFAAEWKLGSQEVWSLGCLKCGELIPCQFRKVLTWNQSARNNDGTWNLDKVRRSVRLRCPKCGHKHKNTRENVAKMNRTGGYLAMNKDADEGVRSFRFNKISLLPSIHKWSQLVTDFLRAKEELDFGNEKPMQSFVNLHLGESWMVGGFDEKISVTTDRKNVRLGAKRWIRTAGVDVQSDHYWVVIRDWSADGDGNSVLRAFARCESPLEIELLLEKWKVGNPDNPRDRSNLKVGVDCAFNPEEVLPMCAAHGWMALRGDPSPGGWKRYDHQVKRRDGSLVDVVSRPYSQVKKASFGRRHQGIAYYMTINVADMGTLVLRLRSRQVRPVSPRWESPIEALGQWEKDYVRQIWARKIIKETDKKGRPIYYPQKRGRDDHAYSCEMYSLAIAVWAGVLIGDRRNTEILVEKGRKIAR